MNLNPGFSTCGDIKEILKIDSCEFPRTRYQTPEVAVSIYFSGKSNNSRIRTVTIALRKLITVEEFQPDLSVFKTVPIPDLPNSKVYRSDRKGMYFTAQDVNDDGQMWVQAITLFKKANR
ncbi:MAG TPA: hypothetical protein VJV05_09955 [Pyrinomonadaceae bacterium]|nr:hypothetical protein [Pyrinomonadaceae bacterium]